MNCKDDFQMKLDANGDPDVRYYIDAAHLMRAEATHAWMKEVGAKIGEKVRKLLHSLHLDGHNPTPHH